MFNTPALMQRFGIRFAQGALIVALALANAPAARCDSYAYLGDGNADFGVIDLNTGVFKLCGRSSMQLSGFGVGTDSKIYGGAFRGSTLYSVNRTNGALTAVGDSGITYFITGSTTAGVYAVDTSGDLYAIDTTNARATRVGPTGVPALFNDTWYGMSTNARALYYTHSSTLYRLNLKTGVAKLVGTAGSGLFGAEVFEDGKLFAGSESPSSVFTLNTSTGASTFISNVSGDNGATTAFWGLVPIKAMTITVKDVCAPHKI
jgi:hypothetical protein